MILSNPVGVGLGAPTASVSIVDDDPLPALSVDDVTITEGDAGTTDATFTVSLSEPSGRTVTVEASTSDATATAPSDYGTTSTLVTFTPGDTSETVDYRSRATPTRSRTSGSSSTSAMRPWRPSTTATPPGPSPMTTPPSAAT